MRRLLALLSLALLLFTAACSDSTGPEALLLTGTWSGVLDQKVLTFTVAERHQRLAGNGYFGDGPNSVAITVEGTHVYPDFSITIRAQGYTDMSYAGELVSTSSLSGRVFGSGTEGEQFVMTRK